MSCLRDLNDSRTTIAKAAQILDFLVAAAAHESQQEEKQVDEIEV